MLARAQVGRVMVQQMDGDLATLTSLNWHLGLHTTLCYKVERVTRDIIMTLIAVPEQE